MIFILFLFSIIIQTVIINKIAKQAIYTSFIIAILRSLASILYAQDSQSDLVYFYFPSIQECTKILSIFDFRKLGSLLYCSGFTNNVEGINLIYGIIGCISMSLLVNLGEKIYKKNISLNPNFIKNYSRLNFYENFNLLKISQLLILIDPVGIIYSSALGKDLFLFSAIVCILYLLHYKSFPVFIFSLPIIISCFYDRPYALMFLSAVSFLAVYLPNIKSTNFGKIISFNLPTKIITKIKLRFLFLNFILTPFLVFIFYKVITSSYLEQFTLSDLSNYLDEWFKSRGGNLSYSIDLPFPIKYVFFWILPLPILQSGLGSIVFGFSTLNYLYFIKEIIRKGLIINNYKIKFLLTMILVFSIFWSYVSFNSGITTRYKFTSCIPPLYILFIYSNIHATELKIKKFNNEI